MNVVAYKNNILFLIVVKNIIMMSIKPKCE